MTSLTSIFQLPDRLSAKADPVLIAADEAHFAALGQTLEQSLREVAEQLDAQRRAPAGAGQSALERDLEVHRLDARMRALRRFGVDLCLGRMVGREHPDPVYVGRVGLTDNEGNRLLVDWRSPAAEPFFGATHANPMGLVTRRRYRWTHGRVTDYWDEAFTAKALQSTAALDEESAFLASLGSSRSSRMRDVLGTIQADQDAIIRAGARGPLVVDGGPGTGKTVVALHRTAYLLYSDPRLARGRDGVLFVGPHAGYLAYVDDVLPSLGEDSVQVCTLRDLVSEGADARPETDPSVIALTSSARFESAIRTAVSSYERPPTSSVTVQTPWADVRITPAEWAEAFDAAGAGTPHNEARDEVWDALLEILVDALSDDRDDDEGNDDFDAYGGRAESRSAVLCSMLARDPDLRRSFDVRWPLVEAADLVARLWSEPEFLRACAPWLDDAGVAALQRAQPRAWTTADLPLLDAARQLLGDPERSRQRQRRAAAAEEERERMSDVVDQLIANDDSELHIMSMLRGQDLRATLVDEGALPTFDPDELAGPFGHIVVDEAQELTEAQWQMLLRRCPSGSFTIVGDRAQARRGFPESWQQRLEQVGMRDVSVSTLTVNYRTPTEVMAEAEPVIRAVLPDANVPVSVRSSGIPVRRGAIGELGEIVAGWLAEHDEGIVCVIGDPSFPSGPRVRSVTPEESKGLEFDLVVLVDSDSVGEGIEGAVDRYVAMTRATQQLVVLG